MQKLRERGEGDARIDSQLGVAPKAADQALGLDRSRPCQHSIPAQPLALITEARGQLRELVCDRGFVVSINHVQRAFRPIGELGLLKHLHPARPAAQRQLEHSAVGLPDGPDHSEITHGCARCSRAALEHHDFQAPRGGRVGVRQAQDAGAYNGHVRSSFHSAHLPGTTWNDSIALLYRLSSICQTMLIFT